MGRDGTVLVTCDWQLSQFLRCFQYEYFKLILRNVPPLAQGDWIVRCLSIFWENCYNFEEDGDLPSDDDGDGGDGDDYDSVDLLPEYFLDHALDVLGI